MNSSPADKNRQLTAKKPSNTHQNGRFFYCFRALFSGFFMPLRYGFQRETTVFWAAFLELGFSHIQFYAKQRWGFGLDLTPCVRVKLSKSFIKNWPGRQISAAPVREQGQEPSIKIR
ncbi:hypothetical protein DOE51_14585 [Bdellovibrio sp. NC01]|nr:hypothetical protein DOE51_14585 [Bdellovibrio sp. NC01]